MKNKRFSFIQNIGRAICRILGVKNYAVGRSYVDYPNNPEEFIEPKRKEKINCFSFFKDIQLWIGAQITPTGNNRIEIFAHGDPAGFDVPGEKIKKISTPEQFERFLSDKSKIWKNRKEGEIITIVLHSCRTGRRASNMFSFAEKMAKSMTNVRIIAPDERDYFTLTGEIGPYKAKKQDMNGEYTDSKDHSKSDTSGEWHVFTSPNINKAIKPGIDTEVNPDANLSST